MWNIIVILLFSLGVYFQGKKLLDNKYYFDLAILVLFYGVAFYYGYGYVSDWDVYNPLDFFIWIFEPVGIKLFIDILGI